MLTRSWPSSTAWLRSSASPDEMSQSTNSDAVCRKCKNSKLTLIFKSQLENLSMEQEVKTRSEERNSGNALS